MKVKFKPVLTRIGAWPRQPQHHGIIKMLALMMERPQAGMTR